MAVTFGGFTPKQLGKIVPEMQGMQADEQAKFLAATPGAAARVGRMGEIASKRVQEAVSTRGFAVGGMAQSNLDTAQQSAADATAALQAARDAQAANPEDTALQEAVKKAEVAVNQAQEGVTSASEAFKQTEMPTTAELMAGTLNAPTSNVTTADTATTTAEQAAAGQMDTTVGQAQPAQQAQISTADTAAPVTTPQATPAATVDAATATPAVQTAIDKLVAATGKPSAEALAQAATMAPDQLAALGIDAATLDAAQKVQAPDARTVQEGELIAGSTVDMDRVATAVNYTAATGVPSTEATVQGQLTGLLEQFEGGETPAWAAGAMRAATAALASRGLGASSMAGQAVIQAAMESALPIAQADANTRAQFESQNLSNRQAAATFAAQQRANFLGIEFDQEFQTRVQNAARISDIANINFSAEQQVALENARLAQSVDLANLSNRNAKVLSDAAALSQLDMTNLNNRQQAQVQQAQAFMQMDMASLNNEQQANVFKTQQITNALLSDAAAENAAQQFNASSENQTTQFFANLTATVEQFNSEQSNAMNRFNAGEENVIEQFNATQVNLREQFNAANSLIIEQANAQWYQTIATTDNAATNQANRDAAASANNMTQLAFNAVMQETRDLMSYAWQTANNDADRATQLALGKMSGDAAAAQSKASKSAGLWGAIGSIGAAMFKDSIF
ncbi:MAG: hypothetical protein GY821_14605 [Gammaproteobacteria bacterium]|nr:hypothetical protein [Gammaproteobacteria bacterium]